MFRKAGFLDGTIIAPALLVGYDLPSRNKRILRKLRVLKVSWSARSILFDVVTLESLFFQYVCFFPPLVHYSISRNISHHKNKYLVLVCKKFLVPSGPTTNANFAPSLSQWAHCASRD